MHITIENPFLKWTFWKKQWALVAASLTVFTNEDKVYFEDQVVGWTVGCGSGNALW